MIVVYLVLNYLLFAGGGGGLWVAINRSLFPLSIMLVHLQGMDGISHVSHMLYKNNCFYPASETVVLKGQIQ